MGQWRDPQSLLCKNSMSRYFPKWGHKYKKGTWVSSQGGIEKVSENLGCAYFRKTAQNSGEKPGLQNDSLMTLKGGGERLRFFGIFYPRK